MGIRLNRNPYMELYERLNIQRKIYASVVYVIYLVFVTVIQCFMLSQTLGYI